MQQDHVTFTKSFRILDLLPFRILKLEDVSHTILGRFAYYFAVCETSVCEKSVCETSKLLYAKRLFLYAKRQYAKR